MPDEQYLLGGGKNVVSNVAKRVKLNTMKIAACVDVGR
jgi:hypothetical protein